MGYFCLAFAFHNLTKVFCVCCSLCSLVDCQQINTHGDSRVKLSHGSAMERLITVSHSRRRNTCCLLRSFFASQYDLPIVNYFQRLAKNMKFSTSRCDEKKTIYAK